MRIGEVYQKGITYFKLGDFVNARKCFLITKKNDKYKAASLLRLALIAEKESNYQEMREISEQKEFNNQELIGKLNMLEYNFTESLTNFSNGVIANSRNKTNLYLKIASLYMNLGEFQKAWDIYQNLAKKEESYYAATMRLSHFYLYFQDYEQALAKIHEIKPKYLNETKKVNDYHINEAILLALMGQNITKWVKDTYVISQIATQDDAQLLKHLAKYRLYFRANNHIKRGSYFDN